LGDITRSSSKQHFEVIPVENANLISRERIKESSRINLQLTRELEKGEARVFVCV